MPAPDFLDTNILLYAYDPSDRKKQHIAHELVRKALAGHILISTQVLAEYAAVLLHKISPPASAKHLKSVLNALAPIRAIMPDGDMVRRAVEARAEYGLRFYDGMIVAAAEQGGCQRIGPRISTRTRSISESSLRIHSERSDEHYGRWAMHRPDWGPGCRSDGALLSGAGKGARGAPPGFESRDGACGHELRTALRADGRAIEPAWRNIWLD